MRLCGIARRPAGAATAEGGVLLERTVARTKTEELGKVEQLVPFDVELDDGQRVRVELARHVRLEPVDVRDGKWSDFEAEPALASLRERAPGPHVWVHVRRARLVEGARVDLLAEDAEHVFGGAGGHRAAPPRKLASVTARAIASGPDASAIVDRLLAPDPEPERPKPPPPRPTLVAPVLYAELVFFLLSVPLFVGAALVPLSPLAADLALGGVLLAAGAGMAWLLRRVPRFVSGGKSLSSRNDTQPGRLPLFLMLFPAVFIAIAIGMDHSGPWQSPATKPDEIYNASWMSAIVLGAWAIGTAIFALRQGREEARLSRVLLGAPALPPEGRLDHVWGSFEGIVRDPTPVTTEGEAMAIIHVLSEELVGGSDPNIYTERVLSEGTFFVDGPNGASIEVHPDGAVWASTVSLRAPKREGHKSIIEHIRAVPLRGSILLAGRVERAAGERGGRAQARGAESLLFVAVREGESPRLACRAALVFRRLALLVALAVLAAAVGTIVVVEPLLPKFNMPAGGD